MIRCAKCRREVHPWPLGHRGCAPRDWVYCISTDEHRWTFPNLEPQRSA